MKLILPVLLILSVNTRAQFHIKGCLTHLNASKVWLAEITGDQMRYIDSAEIQGDCFFIPLKADRAPGMLSLLLDKKGNSYIRLIFNRENIEFRADAGRLLSSIQFTESPENIAFYNYNRKMDTLGRQVEAVSKTAGFYAPADSFYVSANREIKRLNHLMYAGRIAAINANANSFLAEYLKAQQPVTAPAILTEEQKSDFIKAHYTDNVNFLYDPLVHTDILPATVSNYLALYKSNSYTYPQQVESYQAAISNLLSKNMSSTVSSYMTNELRNYFQFGNYDILIAFINEVYVEKNLCHSNTELAALKDRAEKVKRVAVGAMAPEILLDTKGTDRLSKITHPYTLLVFWSTTCPHCTEMLPELKTIYDQQKAKQLEVVAVSIDTSRAALQSFLAKGGYTWINYSDQKGWSGPVPTEFNISGTPTFFLLDKSKKIIFKPFDIEELKTELVSLNITDR